MKPDYRRIHELEYELGLRDDAPPPAHTDAPGAILSYSPTRHPTSVMDIVLELWTPSTLVKQGCPPGTTIERHGSMYFLRTGDLVTQVFVEPPMFDGMSATDAAKLIDAELVDAVDAHALAARGVA